MSVSQVVSSSACPCVSSLNEGSASGLSAELEAVVPGLWEDRAGSSCEGGWDSKGMRRKVAVGLGCRIPAADSKHVSSHVKLEEEITSYRQLFLWPV